MGKLERVSENRRARQVVPGEYGDSNLRVFETALVMEEVAKHCYATAMALMGMIGVQVTGGRECCHGLPAQFSTPAAAAHDQGLAGRRKNPKLPAEGFVRYCRHQPERGGFDHVLEQLSAQHKRAGC